ncbi:MAG: metalloregulator ArsR/SmtB family transcription factor [Nanoarchaeota archaeon]|nr:metalloregulator ArsR/SmtB family transcription factor [Nanoarchaeota archaeon]
MKNNYENFFINFANKNRLKIILLLAQKNMGVGEIVKKTGEEQSAVSHNLKLLVDCKIVNVEKKGKERIYSLNKKTVLPLLELVENHVKCNCAECSKFCKGRK